MRRNVLQAVDQEKDLGIIISADLKCSQQWLSACKLQKGKQFWAWYWYEEWQKI